MDILPEYIKMCEEAQDIVEILSDHVPDRGDWYYTDYEKIIVLPEYDRFHCDEEGYDVRAMCDYIAGDSVWLPRQDQLQDIYLTPEPIGAKINYKFFYAISMFSRNVLYDSYYSDFNSIEQLWLAFVMKDKFYKIWKKGEWYDTQSYM